MDRDFDFEAAAGDFNLVILSVNNLSRTTEREEREEHFTPGPQGLGGLLNKIIIVFIYISKILLAYQMNFSPKYRQQCSKSNMIHKKTF